MKQAEVLEIIKRELRNGILPFGFEVAIGQRNTIVIEKNERKKIIYDDFKVEDFFTLITILEIENVVTPILRKNGLIGGADDELMVTSSLNKLEPELFEKNLNPSYPKTIATEQDVLDLLNDLKEYAENVAEPFFEKWSDLRMLDKFLDTVPQMEVHNYLGGYGVFSKILIYKLCNNPNYQEYFDMMYSFAINRYEENPNADIAIKQKHDFMIDFKEILDNTAPIYNL